MASTVPWTVKTTKRKATTNTPNPRKRRRASLPADDQANSRARLSKQQTLTQIQWAPSRSFSFDESELEPLDFKTEPRSQSRQPDLRLKKRDSTLTQMDFLVGRPSSELDEQELTPLLVPKDEGIAVPKLDGNYDSPRKPRPSKTLGARAGPQRRRKTFSPSADEFQEYLPAAKRGKGRAEADETPGAGQRRRSNRHASKVPSDPVENFAVFQKALADAVPTAIKPELQVKDSRGLDEDIENVVAPYHSNLFPPIGCPTFEVQDSTDVVDKDIEILPASPAKMVPNMIPNTPQKQRRYIPSSQTPESLPPSTKRRHEASRSRLETTPKRNPLSELSTNTPSRRPVNEKEPLQTSAESNVEIRDFVTHPQQTPQKQTQYVKFLQSQSEYTDENDEFGCPVANDTQCAADLARIPTSPLRTSDPLKHLNPHDTVIISSSSPSEGNAPTSPPPSAKLVDRVEYQNSTTTIPTKDLSSPILPPMPPPTQRPICPAPLPHPSQMSTQDPSQQLPQLSSIPQHSPAHTQMITIKDSSSMPEQLSQLPEYHEDELQLQRELEGTQHGVLEDEDDDDDDDAYDDLDPRTPRKTVQFQRSPPEAQSRRDQASCSAPSPSRSEVEDNVSEPSPPAHFTQNGHVTAARIEDMRKRGLIPPGYNPPAYKVPSAHELLPAWMFEDDDDEL